MGWIVGQMGYGHVYWSKYPSSDPQNLWEIPKYMQLSYSTSLTIIDMDTCRVDT